MELIKIYIVFFAGISTYNNAKCSTPELNHIYFHGNSTKDVIYRSFNRRNIKFFMYNRSRPNGYRLYLDNENLRRSGFDNSKPTKFLIHGYMGNYRSNSIQMPKNAYMSVGKYNVVAVDWSAYNFPYAVAVNSARNVGHTIADFVMFMRRSVGLDISQVHIIGHSLGAHIAGYSGKSLISRSNRRKKKKRKESVRDTKLARITGLDPAAPAFSQNRPNERLDAGDAHYVDVIHTSIRLLGMFRSIGHADFYPAGGSNQPRCRSNVIEQATGLCDHGQSYIYYSQSIKKRHTFPANSCTSVQNAIAKRCSGSSATYMGEEAIRGAKGVYYVDVNHAIKNVHKDKS